MDDLINGKISNTLPKTSYQFGIVSANITEVIPPVISKSLKQAFKNFEKKMVIQLMKSLHSMLQNQERVAL